MRKQWRHGIMAAVAAAALIGGAAPAQADLVRHGDWVRENQEQAPTGTEAAAFGHGR